MKPDGNIKICGDFKRLVNPVIRSCTYPKPTPEELLSKTQTNFSKTGPTKACVQVELHGEFHKYNKCMFLPRKMNTLCLLLVRTRYT